RPWRAPFASLASSLRRCCGPRRPARPCRSAPSCAACSPPIRIGGRCSPRCSCTAAGSICSATCGSSGCSGTTSRIRWGMPDSSSGCWRFTCSRTGSTSTAGGGLEAGAGTGAAIPPRDAWWSFPPPRTPRLRAVELHLSGRGSCGQRHGAEGEKSRLQHVGALVRSELERELSLEQGLGSGRLLRGGRRALVVHVVPVREEAQVRAELIRDAPDDARLPGVGDVGVGIHHVHPCEDGDS